MLAGNADEPPVGGRRLGRAAGSAAGLAGGSERRPERGRGEGGGVRTLDDLLGRSLVLVLVGTRGKGDWLGGRLAASELGCLNSSFRMGGAPSPLIMFGGWALQLSEISPAERP